MSENKMNLYDLENKKESLESLLPKVKKELSKYSNLSFIPESKIKELEYKKAKIEEELEYLAQFSFRAKLQEINLTIGNLTTIELKRILITRYFGRDFLIEILKGSDVIKKRNVLF